MNTRQLMMVTAVAGAMTIPAGTVQAADADGMDSSYGSGAGKGPAAEPAK